jgi:alpha-ketoglutarate-dependent taurine dioxygenase
MTELLENPGAAHPRPGLRRRPVTDSLEGVVKESLLVEGRTLPTVIEPAIGGVDLIAWAARKKEMIEARLSLSGAILFRGFDVGDAATFERFVKSVAGDPLEYRERSSPRHQVSGRVYTSTDYPASQSIFMHNENSYQSAWPMRLFFFCETPPGEGGQTPIADIRRALGRISPATRERFGRKNVMYVRNYGDGLGLSWQNVFQSDDKAEVEAYCRKAGIQFEWKQDSALRTRQVGRAITVHPRTGEEVWFNHAAFFHVSTLDPALSQSLIEAVGEENLPNNTYYGDGSPIDGATLDEIRDAYRQESVFFPWRKGDILMLDNMLVAHGRAPYSGPRRIRTAMAQPFTPVNS